MTWPAKYVSRGAKIVESPKKVLEILADSNIFRTKNNESYRHPVPADYIYDETEEKIHPSEKCSANGVNEVQLCSEAQVN